MNKIDLLDMHFFHQSKTVHPKRWFLNDEKWISNKSNLFGRIFFTIFGLPFHHLSIKISTSPSLSKEISSNILGVGTLLRKSLRTN